MILGYRTTRLNENKHDLTVPIKKARPLWRGLNPLTPPGYVTSQVAGHGRTLEYATLKLFLLLASGCNLLTKSNFVSSRRLETACTENLVHILFWARESGLLATAVVLAVGGWNRKPPERNTVRKPRYPKVL